jgi:hypothetical protein
MVILACAGWVLWGQSGAIQMPWMSFDTLLDCQRMEQTNIIEELGAPVDKVTKRRLVPATHWVCLPGNIDPRGRS